MPVHHDAVDLLYAWDKELSQGDHPTEAPFCAAVHHLLSKGRLDDALNDLAGAEPPPIDTEGMNSLTQAAYALAMETMIGEPEDPHAPFGLLVGLPIFGVVSTLSLDAAFWPTVNAHLRAIATAHLGRTPSQFELRPLPQSTRPEALTLLTVDHLRQLTEELGQGDLTGQAAKLVDFNADVDGMDNPASRSKSIQLMGPRMALATLVFDPDDWAPGESLSDWLNDLVPDDAWIQQFLTQERMVMPPMGLGDAMTEALAAQFRLVVDIALDDRDLHPDSRVTEIEWSMASDDDKGIMTFHPTIDGQSLDPVEVPLRWLLLVGADGLQEACAAWNEQDPSWENEGPTVPDESEPEFEPFITPPRKPRLH